MRTHRTVVITLAALSFGLLGPRPVGLDAQEPDKALRAPVDLRIDGLSVYTVRGDTPPRVTVNFRVVNASSHKALQAFRTRVSPGVNTFLGLDTYYVTTPSLKAGASLYIARTMVLPSDTSALTITVEADVDHALVDANRTNNVATTLYTSSPAVGHWVSLGPTRMTEAPSGGLGQYDAVGRLCPIAIRPDNPTVIYVGSPGQLGHEGSGVWKTANSGDSWAPVTDSLPSTSIAAIAIDPGASPDDAGHVYVVVPDYGLYRSDDEGTSWVRVFGDLHVRRDTGIGDPTVLLIDPQNPLNLYLTTRNGVRRSVNGGGAWKTILAGGEATSLVMDPANPLVLYAAIRGLGFYRSGDKGAHWKAIPPAIPFGATEPAYGLLLALSHPVSDAAETVYAVVGPEPGHVGARLIRTTDMGKSWDLRQTCDDTTSDPGACHSLILAVDPEDADRVYRGAPVLKVSEDGGQSFTRVPLDGNDRQPASPHGDYHGFAIDPQNSNIVYAATDGGLYRSWLHGSRNTWSFVSEGVTNAEMYDLALSNPGPVIITGTQDSGTVRYMGSPVWQHIYPGPPFGGDGGVVAMDPENLDALYTMIQTPSSLVQSLDGGGSFTAFKTNLPPEACANYNLTFDFQVHPAVPSTLLASCLGLWRTDADAPGIWRLIFLPPLVTKGRVVRSTVDAAADVYFAGTGQGDGRIYAGVGGFGMKKIFRQPNGVNVTDLEVDPHRTARLYATFAPPTTIDRNCSTPVAGRVYQLRRGSSDPASTSYVAVDITGNLPPNLCANTVLPDPEADQVVYVGTQRGVYRGRNVAGRGVRPTWAWDLYSYGMPLADVRDLEVQASTKRICAATFGRGLFMMQAGLTRASQ